MVTGLADIALMAQVGGRAEDAMVTGMADMISLMAWMWGIPCCWGCMIFLVFASSSPLRIYKPVAAGPS